MGMDMRMEIKTYRILDSQGYHKIANTIPTMDTVHRATTESIADIAHHPQSKPAEILNKTV